MFKILLTFVRGMNACITYSKKNKKSQSGSRISKKFQKFLVKFKISLRVAVLIELLRHWANYLVQEMQEI